MEVKSLIGKVSKISLLALYSLFTFSNITPAMASTHTAIFTHSGYEANITFTMEDRFSGTTDNPSKMDISVFRIDGKKHIVLSQMFKYLQTHYMHMKKI